MDDLEEEDVVVETERFRCDGIGSRLSLRGGGSDVILLPEISGRDRCTGHYKDNYSVPFSNRRTHRLALEKT